MNQYLKKRKPSRKQLKILDLVSPPENLPTLRIWFPWRLLPNSCFRRKVAGTRSHQVPESPYPWLEICSWKICCSDLHGSLMLRYGRLAVHILTGKWTFWGYTKIHLRSSMVWDPWIVLLLHVLDVQNDVSTTSCNDMLRCGNSNRLLLVSDQTLTNECPATCWLHPTKGVPVVDPQMVSLYHSWWMINRGKRPAR